MKKKVLIVATVVKTHINVFHTPVLKMLQEMGYETHVAARNDYENKQECIIPYCDVYHDIAFERNPFKFNNISGYKKLKKIIDKNKYEIIHCHTPVGGVLGRLASLKFRNSGMKVIYTAHGFHFYKGGPIINWLLYYPIEYVCSYFTDCLITINHEDYNLAKQKMKAKKVEYVPGVGIDVDKFIHKKIDTIQKRREIGIPEDSLLLISVGELNENKNHQIIIKAIAQMKEYDIHYIIAGSGELRDYLEQLVVSLGIMNKVHFLGFRKDVAELYKCADVFCFPSIREGLPVSMMEAMACSLPIIAAENRGTKELKGNNNEIILCKYNDVEAFKEAIEKITMNKMKISYNEIQSYGIKNILDMMRSIYRE